MIKNCKQCGKEFEAVRRQIYCCDKCAKEGEAENRKRRKIKYCTHCGKIIPKDSYRRSYCSKECYDAEHLIYMNNRSSNVDMDSDIQKESERLLPPDREIIYETMRLLKDFGIKCTKVPEFKTVGELCNWRKKMIHMALN